MDADVERKQFGQEHPRARYTDREVELVAELRRDGLGFKRIAKVMAIPRRTVRDICAGRIRVYQTGGAVVPARINAHRKDET